VPGDKPPLLSRKDMQALESLKIHDEYRFITTKSSLYYSQKKMKVDLVPRSPKNILN